MMYSVTGTVSGVVGTAAYIGATVAGFPMANVAETIGFEQMFTNGTLLCAVSMFVLLLTVPAPEIDSKPKKKTE